MTPLIVETLVIGDELLTGKTSDTNSTFVGDELFNVGIITSRQTVIPDQISVIQQEIVAAAKRARAVIVFGGLGPTSDDRTAEAVAQMLQCDLVEDARAKENLLHRFKKLGRNVTPQALKQVLYPKALHPLPNPVGAAPGFVGLIEGAQFFFLPGVPEEMSAIFSESVLPELRKLAGESTPIQHETWKCYDIPESELQRLLDPVESKLGSESWMGYRTNPPDNYVTLYSKLGKEDAHFLARKSEVDALLKPHVYSHGQTSLEALILQMLEQRRMNLCFAESCTGGLCVQRMTQVPGSSKRVWGGFTAYQLSAKSKMLGVEVATDEAAVSAACARSLAQNALQKSGADIAGAITGFLGPTGGSEKDPIGTVYLCVADKKGVQEKRVVLPRRKRERLQQAAATHLLHLVRTRLLLV